MNPSCPAPYQHQLMYGNCPYNEFPIINLNSQYVHHFHPIQHYVLLRFLSPEIDHPAQVVLSATIITTTIKKTYGYTHTKIKNINMKRNIQVESIKKNKKNTKQMRQ